MISQLVFTSASEQPKKNKMAFVGILLQRKLLFGLHTNTIIHLGVSESVKSVFGFQFCGQ